MEYNMENVIFHYSRKEQYRFRWEEIPGSRIQVERADGGYVFYIQENGQQRKIPLNPLSKGYKDFEKTLELTGVLHQIGVKTQEGKTCGGSGYVPVHVSDFIEIPADNIIKKSRTENPD